ncbi:MAG: hypothetical protein HY927_02365 [Elusimicrobia bacterium]|nr:hypothetical protein [Elusimicrobiota bacterium]
MRTLLALLFGIVVVTLPVLVGAADTPKVDPDPGLSDADWCAKHAPSVSGGSVDVCKAFQEWIKDPKDRPPEGSKRQYCRDQTSVDRLRGFLVKIATPAAS